MHIQLFIFLFFRIIENKFFFISHQQFGVLCVGPLHKINNQNPFKFQVVGQQKRKNANATQGTVIKDSRNQYSKMTGFDNADLYLFNINK